jgi:thiamine-phosphate pyrophosphorylase
VDKRLIAWGRAAAARKKAALPPLWLFTDSRRMPDPVAAAAHLPRGLAGIVFRHDNHPDRLRLGRQLASICRLRRLSLVVAGDVRLALALRAGVHLRGGFWPSSIRPPRRVLVTSSAHSAADLRRAATAGAGLTFLSPAFPTASHPGSPALGPIRWSALAQRSPLPVAALGGINGVRIRRLSRRHCHAVGAIGALL